MKRLAQALGKLFGLYFASDNQVVPVLRLGRFHRIRGPGFFWIIPLMDRALPALSTGLRVAQFIFTDVLSHDNIAFKFHLTILFSFDPTLPPKSVTAQLVRVPDETIQAIVKDYANQGLRRLASTFEARELGGKVALSTIEQNLTRFLTGEMRILGIAPLKQGGIIIKETIAPEKFQQAMLNARRLETVLQSLAQFPVHGLIGQALQAQFVNNLENIPGDLTLLSTLSPLESMQQPYLLYPDVLSRQTEPRVRNGH